MTDRAEFTKKTKLAAWERCKGHCECGCGQKIIGTPEYDHYPVPAAIGGSNDLSNCRVMSKRCHRVWTHSDEGNPEIHKSIRIEEKRAGVRQKRGGFRGHRKFDGTVVWNNRR